MKRTIWTVLVLCFALVLPSCASDAEETLAPTTTPTAEESAFGTESSQPSEEATAASTVDPTAGESAEIASDPTTENATEPTAESTADNSSVAPSAEPSVAPTVVPTAEPTVAPTEEPTEENSTMDVYTVFEAKSMPLDNGGVFNYRMYVPADYDASKSYPVLIFLHGAGERGADNSKQLKHAISAIVNDPETPASQAIILCPQCPEDNQWVDTPWANGDYSIDEVPESDENRAVLAMLDLVRSSHNVDANRIYIAGLSMGGFGTWDLILRHPDLFAAAVPICGGGDSSKASLITHMPIYTCHGDKDKSVPVEGTRAMVQALIDAGSTTVIYEEMAGYTHNVWTYMSEKTEVWNWLFSQTKASSVE